MTSRAGTPLTLLVWAVLLTGLLMALAAAPGALTLHSVEARRAAVEQNIAREERSASAEAAMRSRTAALTERRARLSAERQAGQPAAGER